VISLHQYANSKSIPADLRTATLKSLGLTHPVSHGPLGLNPSGSISHGPLGLNPSGSTHGPLVPNHPGSISHGPLGPVVSSGFSSHGQKKEFLLTISDAQFDGLLQYRRSLSDLKDTDLQPRPTTTTWFSLARDIVIGLAADAGE